MASPSAGTIRVSCDSSHQIQITIRCTDNCTNPLLITYGNSPLSVRRFDPGRMYSVIINVFDGNQVVFNDQTVTLTSTVMGDKSGIHIITHAAINLSQYIIIFKPGMCGRCVPGFL